MLHEKILVQRRKADTAFFQGSNGLKRDWRSLRRIRECQILVSKDVLVSVPELSHLPSDNSEKPDLNEYNWIARPLNSKNHLMF